MSTMLKVIIGIMIAIMVVCAIVGVGLYLVARSTANIIENTLVTDLAQVAQISSEIAVFTLPDGFGKPFGAQAAGYSLVGFNGVDSSSHIFFFQLPQGVRLDPADLEKQARQAAGPDRVPVTDISVVDRKPGIIAGQEVTLIVSEGINHDKQPYREVTAVFDGKGGQALVNFSRPVAAWNDTEVDAFLASIQ